MKELACTFVIPVYIKEDNTQTFDFFKQTMKSILEQTCPDWSVVLVDDNSQNKLLDEYVQSVIKDQQQTIIYHHNNPNLGPGLTRNVGINLACELGSDIVLFQDCDDLAHPRRVEVTKQWFKDKEADVVYSSFIPIDEDGICIKDEDLAPAIKAIMDGNKKNPPVGKDIWKVIFSKYLYVNLTSATSVRMNYAKKVPFPNKTSEDTYTWIMYSSHGAVFDFIKEIPTKYRIPRRAKISTSREYIGEKFYPEMVEILKGAFSECSKRALEKGTATIEELIKLESLFYINMVFALKMDGRDAFAKKTYRDYLNRCKNAGV